MITQSDRDNYKKYPILLVLLEDIQDKWDDRLIRRLVNRYDRVLKLVYNGNIDEELKMYLLNLIKKDVIDHLKDNLLDIRSKERLKGYYIARWREYIREGKKKGKFRKISISNKFYKRKEL